MEALKAARRIREPCRPDRREEIRTGDAAARMERGKQRSAPFEKACPTCGRPYDNQEAIQASLAAFNLDKARRLEAITAKGSRHGAEISELTVRLDAEMEKARGNATVAGRPPGRACRDTGGSPRRFPAGYAAEAAALESDISSIDAQIAEAKAGTAQGNAAIQSRIDAMKAEARAIMAQIAQSDYNGRAEARIAGLMEEQKNAWRRNWRPLKPPVPGRGIYPGKG